MMWPVQLEPYTACVSAFETRAAQHADMGAPFTSVLSCKQCLPVRTSPKALFPTS